MDGNCKVCGEPIEEHWTEAIIACWKKLNVEHDRLKEFCREAFFQGHQYGRCGGSEVTAADDYEEFLEEKGATDFKENEECDHEWVSTGSPPVIIGGEICLKCKAVRPKPR